MQIQMTESSRLEIILIQDYAGYMIKILEYGIEDRFKTISKLYYNTTTVMRLCFKSSDDLMKKRNRTAEP